MSDTTDTQAHAKSTANTPKTPRKRVKGTNTRKTTQKTAKRQRDAKVSPATKVRGEHRLLAPDTQLRLLAHITAGNSTASFVAQNDGVSFGSVYRTLREDKTFAEHYARAREDQADTYADKLMQITDDVLAGRVDPHAARVAMDAIKWTASKLKPKSYGERTQIDVSVEKRISVLDYVLQQTKSVQPALGASTDALDVSEE